MAIHSNFWEEERNITIDFCLHYFFIEPWVKGSLVPKHNFLRATDQFTIYQEKSEICVYSVLEIFRNVQITRVDGCTI